MVRPLQILWNGGLWDGNANESQTNTTSEPLFSNDNQKVVTKASVKSSDGLEKL